MLEKKTERERGSLEFVVARRRSDRATILQAASVPSQSSSCNSIPFRTHLSLDKDAPLCVQFSSTAALSPTLFLAGCIINIAEFEFSIGTA